MFGLHRRHRTGAASTSHLAARGGGAHQAQSRRKAAFVILGVGGIHRASLVGGIISHIWQQSGKLK